MVINIPKNDRGEVYRKVGAKLGYNYVYVGQVNNGHHFNLKIIEALIYEGELYKKRKAAVMKKVNESNHQRDGGCQDDLHGVHS